MAIPPSGSEPSSTSNANPGQHHKISKSPPQHQLEEKLPTDNVPFLLVYVFTDVFFIHCCDFFGFALFLSVFLVCMMHTELTCFFKTYVIPSLIYPGEPLYRGLEIFICFEKVRDG